jgi:acyl carrier protein
VKLRGFRIELGEIETVLEQHPAVQRAIVTLQEDASGARLVGHVVSDRAPQDLVPELLELLRSKLPAYMVPAFFDILEELPLTPNGKVDRRALAATDAALSSHRGDPSPPETAMEKLIAEVWQEVLGIDGVSVHDNFLDLGGHSLLAIQVATMLEERANVRLELLSFFTQTLGQLATQIDDARPPKKRRRWLPSILRRLRKGRGELDQVPQ